ISPHILHADSRSFKKLIEHLDSRIALTPEEAPFINAQVKKLFETALQYHIGHCYVHDELSHLYDRFKDKHHRAAQTTSSDMAEEDAQASVATLG
ncbi:MAG: hypothetical protein P1U32_08545, partial [Legionellaceae bacterium]|nr:hypothetical protein [Legionellaceae bacterium]